MCCDETDPNDLLDLMQPGETITDFRRRLRTFYWRVHVEHAGAPAEDIRLCQKLHRHLTWFGANK